MIEVEKGLLESIASVLATNVIGNKRLMKNKAAAFNKGQRDTMERINANMTVMVATIDDIINLKEGMEVKKNESKSKAGQSKG